MKTLDRNKRPLWYALYQSKTQQTDANGLITGTETINYSAPVKAYMSVSAQKGVASAEVFGIELDYTVSVITSDMSCPITETSVVWYEIEPTRIVNGVTVNVPHNYVVIAVSRSLNCIAYALKKVDINA